MFNNIYYYINQAEAGDGVGKFNDIIKAMKVKTVTDENDQPVEFVATNYEVRIGGALANDYYVYKITGEEAEGEKYTQGFKATVTPNNDVVKAVKAILSTAGYPDYAVEWSTPFKGDSPYTFAVNVINVPYTATVSAAWDVTVE